MRNIGDVKLENVVQVYSGRHGCMCGCVGKYSVNSAHEKLADKNRGYACPEDVNDRSVKIILSKLKSNVSEVETDSTTIAGLPATIYFLETPTRMLAAYVLN